LTLIYALLVGELALAVAVVFVRTWRAGDRKAIVALGAALFSLILVVMVALRDQAGWLSLYSGRYRLQRLLLGPRSS
jgi:hypothetical protein